MQTVLSPEPSIAGVLLSGDEHEFKDSMEKYKRENAEVRTKEEEEEKTASDRSTSDELIRHRLFSLVTEAKKRGWV